MTRLIAEGLREARPDVRHHPAGDLKGAVTSALDMAGPGEPVLLLYEKLQPVAELLETLGARPGDTPPGDPPPSGPGDTARASRAQAPDGQVMGSPT